MIPFRASQLPTHSTAADRPSRRSPSGRRDGDAGPAMGTSRPGGTTVMSSRAKPPSASSAASISLATIRCVARRQAARSNRVCTARRSRPTSIPPRPWWTLPTIGTRRPSPTASQGPSVLDARLSTTTTSAPAIAERMTAGPSTAARGNARSGTEVNRTVAPNRPARSATRRW